MMLADPETNVTPHQLELLALYASGYTLPQIAEMRFVSYSAVKQSLAQARERVGAKSLTHLCVILVDTGMIKKNGNGYKPARDDYGVIG